ncbi:MAG: hypothetical protein A3I05_07390 [Deltaproteobacteria bacterium RIFCSPLOWO2_02_FULL_44_10]|nr:MAG: hypothetical protein A3C46_01940 [Deltaproteobacteria bacterium RIFCSPHIGHO2_02_FULL_44_16]OGQ45658.1 MAG: hypothetical protein A3I05_07390 [Deltaproteobacteria bacterium RIFCSPLOWO2_02_FULL_44_10]
MVISVKVGELRNRLSAYLKRVRRGAEVVVTDRDTPIGRLIPYDQKNDEKWDLIHPPKGYEKLSSLSFPEANGDISAVEELLRERRKR